MFYMYRIHAGSRFDAAMVGSKLGTYDFLKSSRQPADWIQVVYVCIYIYMYRFPRGLVKVTLGLQITRWDRARERERERGRGRVRETEREREPSLVYDYPLC